MSKDKSLGEFIKDSRQRDKEAMQRLEVATQRLETHLNGSLLLALVIIATAILGILWTVLAPILSG